MLEQLTRFPDRPRDKALDHAAIRQLLLAAGWKEAGWKEYAVAEVFCKLDSELPIPEPPRSTAKVTASRPA